MNTKNIFIRTFLLTAFLGLCFVAQSQNADNSQIKTAKFTVEGMHCGGCATNVRNTLNKQDGVLIAKVDFTNKTAEVQYDGSKIDENKLLACVERLGFKATSSNGTITDGKSCTKTGCTMNKNCCKKSAKN